MRYNGRIVEGAMGDAEPSGGAEWVPKAVVDHLARERRTFWLGMCLTVAVHHAESRPAVAGLCAVVGLAGWLADYRRDRRAEGVTIRWTDGGWQLFASEHLFREDVQRGGGPFGGFYWDGGPGAALAARVRGTPVGLRVGWGFDADVPLRPWPTRWTGKTPKGHADTVLAWLGFYVGWTVGAPPGAP